MSAGKTIGGVIAVAALVATIVGIWMTVRQADRSDFASRQNSCLDAVEKYSTNQLQLAQSTSPITSADSAQDLRNELVVERFCLSADLIDPHSAFADSWHMFEHDARLLLPQLNSQLPDVAKIEHASLYMMINNSVAIRDWVEKQQPPGWWPWENRSKGAPKFDYTDSPPPLYKDL